MLDEDLLRYVGTELAAGRPILLNDLTLRFGSPAAQRYMRHPGVWLDHDGVQVDVNEEARAEAERVASSPDEVTAERVYSWVEARTSDGFAVFPADLAARFGGEAVQALWPVAGLEFARDRSIIVHHGGG
jgi:hypothetical protein